MDVHGPGRPAVTQTLSGRLRRRLVLVDLVAGPDGLRGETALRGEDMGLGPTAVPDVLGPLAGRWSGRVHPGVSPYSGGPRSSTFSLVSSRSVGPSMGPHVSGPSSSSLRYPS